MNRLAIIYRQGRRWRAVDLARGKTIAKGATRREVARMATNQGYQPQKAS